MWRAIQAASSAAALIALIMNIGIARADTIQTLSISGTETESGPEFNPSVITAVSGSITLDYTLGLVTSLGFAQFGLGSDAPLTPPVFTVPLYYVPEGSGPIDFTITLSDEIDDLYLTGTITGGGETDTLFATGCAHIDPSNIPPGCGPGNFLSISATIGTPETPLPATLPLFVSGLGFFGYLTRSRKRSGRPALVAV